jgi:ABC-type amino acid transport system permease subunit
MQEQRSRQAHRGGSGCVLIVGYAIASTSKVGSIMASLPSAQRASRHRFRSRTHWLRPTGGGFGATDWGGLRNAVIALIKLVRGVPMLVALYLSSFIVPMMIPGVQVNLFVSVIASGFTAPYGRSRFRLISSAIPPVRVAATLATAGPLKFGGIIRRRSLRCNAAAISWRCRSAIFDDHN